MKANFGEVVLLTDQPMTCPKCGARTNVLLDLTHINCQPQIHRCLNDKCANLFVTGND